MGSANTPESIMHFYRLMNLSQCSLNLINIPSQCTSMYFCDIFEFCVKNKPNSMIPIAIYKKHSDDSNTAMRVGGQPDGKGDFGATRSEERIQRKSYVWLHPPRKIELAQFDQLFVLCENAEKDDIKADLKDTQGETNTATLGGSLKNEGKKMQNESMKSLGKLNAALKELSYFSSELQKNVEKSG